MQMDFSAERLDPHLAGRMILPILDNLVVLQQRRVAHLLLRHVGAWGLTRNPGENLQERANGRRAFAAARSRLGRRKAYSMSRLGVTRYRVLPGGRGGVHMASEGDLVSIAFEGSIIVCGASGMRCSQSLRPTVATHSDSA